MRLPRQICLPFASLIQSVPMLKPDLELRRLAVRIRDLPPALDGFRIAQISDLHVGLGDWMPFHADRVVDAIQSERPDVIVDTGDFMVGEPPIGKVASTAARFLPSWPSQVRGPTNLVILGNHDYYAGPEIVLALETALESLDIRVLRNQGACVEKGDAGLSIFGLTPQASGADEVANMLAMAPRPRIVLVHDPDDAEMLPPGSVDLVLSGHTHGGQIALPGLREWAVRHFNGSRYVQGMYHINGNRVYVNRGLGCTGLPVRFRAAPELTIIQLSR